MIGTSGARRCFHNRTRKMSIKRNGENIMNVPSEFAIGGVYMPPQLIAAFLGTLAAVVTARILNHFRLSRYFFYPPLVFVAFAVIFTVLFGTVLIPF